MTDWLDHYSKHELEFATIPTTTTLDKITLLKPLLENSLITSIMETIVYCPFNYEIHRNIDPPAKGDVRISHAFNIYLRGIDDGPLNELIGILNGMPIKWEIYYPHDACTFIIRFYFVGGEAPTELYEQVLFEEDQE